MSNDGGKTRVVFSLAPGVTYALTPSFGGLRLEVQGARVPAQVLERLGASVRSYGATERQILLATAFPLSLSNGWRASEATISSGTRVLILEFGPTLVGGASKSMRGLLRPPAAPGTALVQPVVGTASSRTVPGPTLTPASPVVGARPPEGVTPGDVAAATSKVMAPPKPPALPGQIPGRPSALAGQVLGRLQAGVMLTAPRVGKNPGMTRVVLDLPPGTRYRLEPGGIGLRVELTGVTAAALSSQNISPEIRGWRYEPTRDGVTVTLLTGTVLTVRSGWRAQLIAPTEGSDRSRLAIDLAPALADLTPLPAREQVLTSVPALPVSRGTALLAVTTQFVKPRVVIDAGHGGRDPGGVGAVVEKQVALNVALHVRGLLRAAGVDVVMTRESDRELHPNKATDLNMRAAMANSGAQLFLSIHVNAIAAQNALRAYGVETWWNPNHPLSNSFAALIQKNAIAVTGASSRGLKNNQSLAVLHNNRVPAALVEIGYTSHPVDGLNLQDTNYLNRVAVGIAQGIHEALVTGVTATGVGGAEK